MKLKVGVKIKGIQPEIVVAMLIIDGVFNSYKKECVITVGTDGKHMKGSLHYPGYAIDVRSKHLTAELKQSILSDMKAALGRDFDVILENLGKDQEHYHVEFDPK